MSIRYDHNQAREFIDDFKSKSDVLEDELAILSDKILNIVNKAEFEGEFAAASKSYLSEAVIPAIDGFKVLLEVYNEQYDKLLNESMDVIDEKEGARISTEDITEVNTVNENLYQKVGEKVESVNIELDNINDIISITKLDIAKAYGGPEIARGAQISSSEVYDSLKKDLDNIQEGLELANEKDVYYEEIETQIAILKQLFNYMDGVNAGGIATYNESELKSKGWYTGLLEAIENRLATYPEDYFIYKDVPPPLTASEQAAFADFVAKMIEEGNEEWFNNLLNNSSGDKLSYYAEVLANQSANAELFSNRQNSLLMMSNVFSNAAGIIKYNYSMGVDNLTGYDWVHPNFEITFDTVNSAGEELIVSNLTYDLATGFEYILGSTVANANLTSVRRGINVLIVPGSLFNYDVGQYITELIRMEQESGISKACVADENASENASFVASFILSTGLTISTGGLSTIAQVGLGAAVVGIQYLAEQPIGSTVENAGNIAFASSSANDNVGIIVSSGQTAVVTNFDDCFSDGNNIYIGKAG